MGEKMLTANLRIGHATDSAHNTGCTVFLCPPQTTAGVDIRGMAPGSREIALLDPIKSVPHVNAIMLTGGSAYGLATADGAMRYLHERNIGHWTPVIPVPIVPTAVIYDLFLHGGVRMPDSDMGYAACVAADTPNTTVEQGCVGAGAGATVGKWISRLDSFMKSGIGFASTKVGEAELFAAAVVNAVGDVVNPDGSVLAGARDHQTGEWYATGNKNRINPTPPTRPTMTNTTLVVVATTVKLNKVEANRLAQRAHDGFALSIWPVHTMHDGDCAFALSTGKITGVPFDAIANTAVHLVADAVRNAVRYATTAANLPGLASETG